MRRRSICLLINLSVCICSYCQQAAPANAIARQPVINDTTNAATASLIAINKTVVKFYNAPITVIPQNYYIGTIGFFCKKEIQMKKAIRFPIKIRLGSVAYTDKMEGKGAGVLLP